MENEKAGIDETTDVVVALGSAFKGLAQAEADKAWTLGDAAFFIPFLQKVPNAVKGSSKIPTELADLTDPEIEQLKTSIREAISLPDNEETEQAVEDVLIATLTGYKAIASIQACLKGKTD